MVVLFRPASSSVRPTWSSRSLVLCEDVAELAELGLDRAQHPPDLGRALLDRQRAEAHLQAVEHRREVHRPGQHHPELALQRVREPRPRHRLGVEALGRHEQDREVGGVRRLDVLVADRTGLRLEEPLQRLAARLDRADVGPLDRLLQPLVVLQRKLGVDRQPARLAVLAAAREPDRELDALAAARTRRDVLRVLRRREHLREQRAELHLAPAAAALDVGQHLLEVAHARGEVLHLAQPLVHLVEAVGHLLERLPEALLERGLQLFVHGRAHLLELGRIVGAQRLEVLRDARAHRFEPLLVGRRQRGQPVAELLQLPALQRAHAGELLTHRLPELRQRGRELAAGGLRRGRLLLPRDRQVLPQVALEVRALGRQHLETGAQVGGFARRGFARRRQRGQPRQCQRRQHDRTTSRTRPTAATVTGLIGKSGMAGAVDAATTV